MSWLVTDLRLSYRQQHPSFKADFVNVSLKFLVKLDKSQEFWQQTVFK